VGEYDIPDVHAHSGVINAGIANSKREIISNAGHLIPFEQPEAFNASVFKFLNNMEFYEILNAQGVKAAVQYFERKREVDSGFLPFDEGEINTLAYSYLQEGKVDEAIALFILNTIAFPNSANTYDSLGEAYMNAGNKELAIKNYEKSLELNPNNTNAVEQLKKLRGN
jgi:tetratricopeptide (TPR) repeat protein